MKIFIAGPRVIKELDKNITIKLNNICEKNYNVLIGDAEGIDSSIQKFFYQKFYQFKGMSDLENFLNANVKLDSKLKRLLPKKCSNQFVQACLF